MSHALSVSVARSATIRFLMSACRDAMTGAGDARSHADSDAAAGDDPDEAQQHEQYFEQDGEQAGHAGEQLGQSQPAAMQQTGTADQQHQRVGQRRPSDCSDSGLRLPDGALDLLQDAWRLPGGSAHALQAASELHGGAAGAAGEARRAPVVLLRRARFESSGSRPGARTAASASASANAARWSSAAPTMRFTPAAAQRRSSLFAYAPPKHAIISYAYTTETILITNAYIAGTGGIGPGGFGAMAGRGTVDALCAGGGAVAAVVFGACTTETTIISHAFTTETILISAACIAGTVDSTGVIDSLAGPGAVNAVRASDGFAAVVTSCVCTTETTIISLAYTIETNLITYAYESADMDSEQGAPCDLLVLIDSDNICRLFESAWRMEDLWKLRNETYGLRMEEAILLRRWIQKLGGVVDVIRISSHVGFIPNVIVDAAAGAAAQLRCRSEPPMIVRRTLAYLRRIGGVTRCWADQQPPEWCAGELDGKIAQKVREHVNALQLRRLIDEQARVLCSTRDGVAADDEIERLVLLPQAEELNLQLQQVRCDLHAFHDGTHCGELIEGRYYDLEMILI